MDQRVRNGSPPLERPRNRVSGSALRPVPIGRDAWPRRDAPADFFPEPSGSNGFAVAPVQYGERARACCSSIPHTSFLLPRTRPTWCQ